MYKLFINLKANELFEELRNRELYPIFMFMVKFVVPLAILFIFLYNLGIFSKLGII